MEKNHSLTAGARFGAVSVSERFAFSSESLGQGTRNRLLRGPGLAVVAVLASAAFAPSAWRFRQQIPAGSESTISVVPLSAAVYRAARADLADLRVVHDGREVPYILDRLSAREEDREIPAEIVDKSISGGALQLTLAARHGDRHNRVRIATPRTNFRQPVTVETSDDNRTWSMVRDDAELFDFTEKGHTASLLSVDYPASTRPYVRLTIAGWRDLDAVSRAWLHFTQKTPAVRITLADLSPKIAQDAGTQSTLLTLDPGAALPCSRLEFEIATPRFSRAVKVESSPDGKAWSLVVGGVLTRMENGSPAALEFPELHERYLRIRVFNRDDQPLDIQRVRMLADERLVKFESAGGGNWWLYYGNPEAKAPEYDLAAVLPHDTAAAVVLKAGSEQTNPDYRPPPPVERPWTERHPIILYVTLGLAVVVLGAVTIRFLRGVV